MNQLQVLYSFALVEFAALYYLERVQTARLKHWVDLKVGEREAAGETKISLDAAEFNNMRATQTIRTIKSLVEMAMFATVGLYFINLGLSLL
jgi:hypothetical protein